MKGFQKAGQWTGGEPRHCSPSRQDKNVFQEGKTELLGLNSGRWSKMKTEFIIGLGHRQIAGDLGNRYSCGIVRSDPNWDWC